jgi:hypothetical protein
MSEKRPGPWLWLRYAFGAGLPDRYREWVLRDTTAPTWILRHLARAFAQILLLIVAVLVFVPGPFWIRATMAVGGILIALLFSLAYMTETVEHRLVKAGYPSGTGEAVRERRVTRTRTEALARRRERIAARQDHRSRP